MSEIIIKTQAEFDALPEKFDEFTYIKINSSEKIIINRAWGNSSVVARGNSRVEAWGNCSVVAWGNSSIYSYSSDISVALYGFAVLFLIVKCVYKKISKYSIIQKVKNLGFFENNGIKKTKTIILYKKVSKDFKTQENTENETLWLINSTVIHKNWQPEKEECGTGKFHACSKPYFCDEFRNNEGDKYIALSIKLSDLFEWKNNPQNPHKIGVRAAKVLYEVDKFGEKI